VASVALEPVNVRPGSLTEIVFDKLRDAIVSKELSPGSRVSESMLAGMLNVSKTPVREALLRLCYMGLVEPTGRGLRVVQPNREIIRDAYELRSSLEASAAMSAARRAEGDHRRMIAEAARSSLEHAQAADASGFAEWDLKFHLAVADASRNQLLAKAVKDSVMLAFTLRSRDVPTVDDSIRYGSQHVDIARAINDGDAEQASELMCRHITEVMEHVLSFAD
jgi:DNA-binding GntR family transcriptional regulator